MNALLSQFNAEARDLLAQAGSGLLTLERDTASAPALNDVFRAVHTLKGSSGLFDLKPLTGLVHVAEDLLGEVRNGSVPLTSAMVDALLDCLDLLGLWVDALEASEALPATAEAAMQQRVAVLASWLDPADHGSDGAASAARSAIPDWLADFPRDERVAAAAATTADTLTIWSFVPDADCFFRGDDPLAMMRAAPGLLAVKVALREPMPRFDAVDPLVSMLQFHGIADADYAAIEHHFRYAAEAVDIRTIDRAALADAVPAAPATTGTAPDHASILAAEQLAVLETAGEPEGMAGRVEAVGQVLKGIGRAKGRPDVAAAVDTALAAWHARGSRDELALIAASLAGDDRVAAASTETAAPQPEAAANADARPAAKVLRVDQGKVDTIMNLVAELIVAKNGLSYLASRTEQMDGGRAVAREILDQFAVIDRITQGLQLGIMSVRMMPVSQLFQRFPRLVRDISRKLGKEIELIVEGEDTEADKNVLESLGDPLIHMVRNSLDHGIETPEARLAAGKPAKGTLRISARQESDFVIIEVRDDGKGIDPAAVKAKALKLGLITPQKAEQMGDQEAANLVFAAGFSTKEQISDLSGRGVGMDVVRTAVMRAGGEVTLQSVLGQGTSVGVRLPLTMAVTRIVTIVCRDRLFGIPMDVVVETVRVATRDLHRIKTAEAFVLRDVVIPIVRLADVLALPPGDEDQGDKDVSVMVVDIAGNRVGLVVDGFRERMEVIVRPLEGVVEGLHGFSGTTLMGDGQVLLVLDPKAFL